MGIQVDGSELEESKERRDVGLSQWWSAVAITTLGAQSWNDETAVCVCTMR